MIYNDETGKKIQVKKKKDKKRDNRSRYGFRKALLAVQYSDCRKI
jgi:hypothetical protein